MNQEIIVALRLYLAAKEPDLARCRWCAGVLSLDSYGHLGVKGDTQDESYPEDDDNFDYYCDNGPYNRNLQPPEHQKGWVNAKEVAKLEELLIHTLCADSSVKILINSEESKAAEETFTKLSKEWVGTASSLLKSSIELA